MLNVTGMHKSHVAKIFIHKFFHLPDQAKFLFIVTVRIELPDVAVCVLI
jgi:hypothetical protein